MLLPLALAARVILLATRPLWSDELFTVWASRLPVAGLLAALRSDSGPPGFYLLEKPFVRLAETLGAESLVRLLPFLAAILLVAAARALPAGTARRIGTMLLGGHALLGLYAVEARAYALLALLGLLLFRLAREGEETGGRLAATLTLGVAALYTHYLAIPVVAALLALSLARRRFRTALALTGSAILFAPWLPVLAGQPAAATSWMREPAGASALGFLSALGGVGHIPLPFGPPLPPILSALGIAAGAALLLAIAPAARHDREARDAALLTALVLGAALAVSLWRPFAFPGRTEMAVLPIWVWGVAHASRESRMARAAGIAAASLGLLTVGLLALSPHPPSAAARASGALERLARPDDALFAGPGLYLPFRLAADRGRLAPRLWAFPGEVAEHPGWWQAAAPRDSDYEAVAAACAARPRGVFLLLPPGFVTPRLREILTAQGSVRELPLRPEAVLLHWTPRP
ncbi:MAG: hypothetical protein ACRD3M_13590 [Thermoanaerobaculia bacterium]